MDSETRSTALDRDGPPGLRLFLDSADVSAWHEWLPTGLFFGLTTNPWLLEKVEVPCSLSRLDILARQGFEAGAREIHLQAWGGDADTLERSARGLAAIDPRVVVKIPVTRDGVIAASNLIAEGIRVTLTAVYAAHQALTAAAVGTDYAAPYLGRMCDAKRDGYGEIVAMRRLVTATGSPMRLLVASLRRRYDLTALAQDGLDTFTIPPDIAASLFDDPFTAEAAASFEAAAKRSRETR